jgi:hypothetical protein
MAGIITIKEHLMWTKSNWVYWNLMDQVLEIVKNDPTVAYRVEQSKWMQHLGIPSMIKDETELADTVLTALKTAAQRCSEGQIAAQVNGRVLDDVSQRQFREATGELLTMLSAVPNADHSV